MDLTELEHKRELVRPAGELMENPHFVAWVQGVREELKALKELPWALGSRAGQTQMKILESCGLGFPETSEKLLECFMATKAVVHWAEKRLREFEQDAERYRKIVRKIQQIAEEEMTDGTDT